MKRVLFLVAAINIALSAPSIAAGVTATAIRTIDGDTIVVRLNGHTEHVRVYGINAPEKWEPLWKEAKELTVAMTANREVTLTPKGRDRFGRLLACVVADGKMLGLELVAHGLARVYSNQYAPDDMATYREYQQAQIAAMTHGRGIWGEEVIIARRKGPR